MPASCKTAIAEGWTYPAGRVPADATVHRSPTRCLQIASTICDRHEFPVQIIKTDGFAAEVIEDTVSSNQVRQNAANGEPAYRLERSRTNPRTPVGNRRIPQRPRFLRRG